MLLLLLASDGTTVSTIRNQYHYSILKHSSNDLITIIHNLKKHYIFLITL